MRTKHFRPAATAMILLAAMASAAMALPRGDGSPGDHDRAATAQRRPSYQYSYPGLYYQPVYVEPCYRYPVRGRSRPFYGPVVGLRWYAL